MFDGDIDKEDVDAARTVAGTLVAAAVFLFVLDKVGFRFVIGVGG